LPFVFSQTFFGMVIAAGAGFTLVKFAFYFLGEYAKFYPQEQRVTLRHKIGFLASFAMSILAMVVIPGVGEYTIVMKAIPLLIAAISLVMFYVVMVAQNRFKGNANKRGEIK